MDECQLHFPARLYQMIEREDESVICWESDGESFRIVDAKRFKTELIPKYFPNANFPSIQRQLNLYGFLCRNRVHLKGVYFHPEFMRGEYEAVREMRRKRTWKLKSKPNDKKTGVVLREDNSNLTESNDVECSYVIESNDFPSIQNYYNSNSTSIPNNINNNFGLSMECQQLAATSVALVEVKNDWQFEMEDDFGLSLEQYLESDEFLNEFCCDEFVAR